MFFVGFYPSTKSLKKCLYSIDIYPINVRSLYLQLQSKIALKTNRVDGFAAYGPVGPRCGAQCERGRKFV